MANSFSDLMPGNSFSDLMPRRTQPEPWEAYAPAAPAPGATWTNKLQRLAVGAAEPAAGLAQLAAHVTGVGTETADAAAAGLDQYYQGLREKGGLTPESWDLWGGAGNIMSPVNYVPGAAAGKAASLARIGAEGLGNMAARAGIYGATSGASQPVPDAGSGNYAASKALQTGLGTVAGAGAGVAGGLAAHAISPLVSRTAEQMPRVDGLLTPEAKHALAVQDLVTGGAEPLIGQTLGGNFRRAEEVLSRAPFAGQSVVNAEERVLGTYNRGAYDKSLKPIGKKLPSDVEMGHPAFAEAEKLVSAAYDEVHPKISVVPDVPLLDGLQRRVAKAAQLGPGKTEQLQAIVDGQIMGKIAGNDGKLSGKSVQSITSELGQLSREMLASSHYDDRALGRAVGGVREEFADAIARQNPEQAPALKRANESWRLLMTLEKPVGATASSARGGVFTPTQLDIGSKAADTSRRRARASAVYQDWAESGRKVLSNKMPNSGTPERQAWGALGTGVLAGSLPVTIAPMLGAWGITAAAYTPAGQRLLRAAVMKRPAGAYEASKVLQHPDIAAGLARAAVRHREKTDRRR